MPLWSRLLCHGSQGLRPEVTCAWCDKPATKAIVVRKRARANVTAPACPEHALKYGPAPKQRRATTRTIEVTPPICESCGAEVTWVQLMKDGQRGKRMPIERKPLQKVEPRFRLVAYNKRTGQAVVLTKALVDDAKAWVKAGAQLHRGHFCQKRKPA